MSADAYAVNPFTANGRSLDDLTGQRFGRLLVIDFAGYKQKGSSRLRLWRCQCDCGGFVDVVTSNLQSGNSTSCGCRQIEAAHARRTHGLTGTPVYHRWRAMVQRCTNPACRSYPDYGGRGIRVCDRWLTFTNFYADMGTPPAGMTLERVDVNGDYEPANCQWATTSRQARNRRASRLLALNGETKSLADWVEQYGAAYQLVYDRLQRGWTLERALMTPSGGAS